MANPSKVEVDLKDVCGCAVKLEAANEQELAKKVADHAKQQHNIKGALPKELEEKFRKAIKRK
ncbi:MAG: hypothetical protein ARM1_0339 [Candidatus Micrarchaeota archaeon]|nr:MAG: hypothetical protein ARM1_0339 [Candidatus Micrarchaeota archaeon]